MFTINNVCVYLSSEATHSLRAIELYIAYHLHSNTSRNIHSWG